MQPRKNLTFLVTMIYQSRSLSPLASCPVQRLMLKIKIIEGGGANTQKSSDDNMVCVCGGDIENPKNDKNQYLIFLKIGTGLKLPSVTVEGLFIDWYKETSSKRRITASFVALKAKARSNPLISRAACE